MAESPYRDDDKALRDLIPPDDRKKRAALLVALSAIAGGALVLVVQSLLAARDTRVVEAPVVEAPSRDVIGAVTLTGPGGTFRVPGKRPMVLHVWLQGCADCMPAFDSMFALSATGGMRLPVDEINVAYGKADETWARAHGVSKNLVLDPGGRAVVAPLGIRTFTTLVVDTRGHIVHRDRPDRVGYAVRVSEALRRLGCYEGTVDESGYGCGAIEKPTTEQREPPLPERIAAHSAEIRTACWNQGPGESLTTATVDAEIEIAPSGNVSRVDVRGPNRALNDCVAREIRSWKLPTEDTKPITVRVPFRFSRAKAAQRL